MNFSTLKRTWITAEIGANHEGNIAVAKDLIRKASLAGVDAVKFQNYTAERYISRSQRERQDGARSRELTPEQFRNLAEIAKENNVTFFSTPLSLTDVDLIEDFTPIYKVASGEITWLDLIRHITAKNRPLILSTGGATFEEIRIAVDAVYSVRPEMEKNGELMLMHCVMAYPAKANSINLLNIRTLQKEFGLPVGYSDHTLGNEACVTAVAVGAVALEKHFTYRKENQTFRDHQLSANPEEMAHLVSSVRHTELLLGRYDRQRQPEEEEIFDSMRRSAAAAVDIPQGVPIKQEWLTALRPALGISVQDSDKIITRKARHPIKAGVIISDTDLEAS